MSYSRYDPKNYANIKIDEGLNNKLVKDLRDEDGVLKSPVSPAGQFDKERVVKMMPLSDQAQSLLDFDVKGTYTYKFRLQRGDYVRISIDGGTRVYVGIIDQIVIGTIHTGPASFNGYAFVGFFAEVKSKKCSYMEIVDDKPSIDGESYMNVYVGKPNIQLVKLLNSVK